MKLSNFKTQLDQIDEITFQLENGQEIPKYFHVTEVGQVNKHFIDCGGTERKETTISFQLWTASDYDHRLSAQKLASILKLSEDRLGLVDAEIEVEYQSDTIGKYGLDFQNGKFVLTSKQTDCLAKDNCGIPQQKPRIRMSTLGEVKATSCAPGSGCC